MSGSRLPNRNTMRYLQTLCLATLACGAVGAESVNVLEQQRTAFRDAYAAAELGNWEPAAEHRALLQNYALWPDLHAAYLRTAAGNINDAEIAEFLARYGTLKPARELRYRHALRLAAAGHMGGYLEIYERFYQGLGVARLDCLAVNAEILRGNGERAANRAMDLWLTGYSQADECDPVFDYLRGAGQLDETAYRQRFELALSAQQYSLARFLARSIDEQAFADADQWLTAENRSATFLDSETEKPDSPVHRKRVLFALERIAYTDARLADEYWQEIRDRRAFSPQEVASISRHVALWLARQHEPDAGRRLRELPDEIAEVEVARWLVRTSLKQRAWGDVIAGIRSIPAEERGAEEWQYWLAMALLQTGDDAAARTILEALAAGRSYYSFLAADELELPYAFAHASLTPDARVIADLEGREPFIRARELFHVGLESRGRSEWDEAVSLLGPAEKAQAALLAHRWGWHSRAIATVAATGDFDDLELRYPMAYPEEFRNSSQAARVPHSWAYGVARSESLFMPDIRSSAGAVGIMQLMPATGRRTADDLNYPWQGLATLTDPASNIRLGTTYLADMLEKFAYNRVAATAAYNAGPSRVEKWLPESGQEDARIWIENIPYNETRDYVRRVMVSDAIFNWRLTGRTQRLTGFLGTIGSDLQQLAGARRKRPPDRCDTVESASPC
ncbi:MAG TPA: transglycosylase SLT domain-containing protein [Woeseiaceae bacterium]|nr:transglycosylase SLT domain-containing protein [Woeseiaceae bacterium]